MAPFQAYPASILTQADHPWLRIQRRALAERLNAEQPLDVVEVDVEVEAIVR